MSENNDTHFIYNKNTKEIPYCGTENECTAFLRGLEYGDDTDDSIPYFTVMRENKTS